MADAEYYAKALRDWSAKHPVADIGIGFVPGVGQIYGAAQAGAAQVDPRATTFDKVASAAGMLPFGSLLRKGKGAISKMVIGEKGATEAEKKLLTRAKEMWAARYDPKPIAPSATSLMNDIYGKTGWWRREVPFGEHWKREISDQAMDVDTDLLTDMHLNRVDSTRLGDVVKHGDLYRRYPGLENVQLIFQPGRGGEYWAPLSWRPQGERIGLGRQANPKNTLLHEMTHGVQNREGFEGGTSQAIAGNFRNYLSDMGEVEARTNALRRVMTNAQRKAYPMPRHLEDEHARVFFNPDKPTFDPTYEELSKMLKNTGLTPNDIIFEDVLAK